MRLPYRCLILCLVVSLVTGCWSHIEINDRAFVTAMFVDLGEKGEVQLTLGFPLTNRLVPSSAGGISSGNVYTTVTKSGVNLAEAYRKIQAELPRRVTLGTTRLAIIGRKYAEHGILPLLEFMTRQPAIQLKTYMFVAENTALETSKLTPAFERFPSEVIREFANQRMTVNTTLRDFLMAYQKGGDTMAAMLTADERELLSEKGKKGIWVGTSGAALFHRDRMVGEIGPFETRGAMWITDRIRSSVVTVFSPTDGKPISILINRATVQIKPKFEKDNIVFQIKVKASDEIASSDSNMDIKDPSRIGQLERMVGDLVAARMQKAFAATKTTGSDAFQLAEYVDIYNPKRWKALKPGWHDYYREHVRLDIRTKISINRSGSERNPIWRTRGGAE
jgi:spore germination protein KC